MDKGVLVKISSDGGTKFTSLLTAEFLLAWGVCHRFSSAHYPQSKGHAKAAVKSGKRMLCDNVSLLGSLDMDKYILTLMTHRNTPDPVSLLSLAQVLYGRRLRDALQFSTSLEKYLDPNIRATWRDTWRMKEEANCQWFFCQGQSTNSSSCPKGKLPVGQRVFVQSKHPNFSLRSFFPYLPPGKTGDSAHLPPSLYSGLFRPHLQPQPLITPYTWHLPKLCFL